MSCRPPSLAPDASDLLARFAPFDMLDACARERVLAAARPIHAARGFAGGLQRLHAGMAAAHR